MIRKATFDDRTPIVELLRESHEAAGFHDGSGPTGFVVPFEEEEAEKLLVAHLVNPACCAFVLDLGGRAQGVLLAVAFKHQFGNVRVAKESTWWITRGHRGPHAVRMLDAYEDWAFQKEKCQFAGMAGMGEDPDVAKLYLRRGYKNAETHYLLRGPA